MIGRMRLLVVTVAIAGCGPAQELPASGTACVSAGDITLLPGSPSHEVEVRFAGCLEDCGPGPDPKCEVRVEGSDVWIDAWIEVGPTTACGNSCREQVAICDWPEGLVGDFVVHFGGNEVDRSLDEHPDFCVDAA